MFGKVIPYRAPKWAQSLTYLPKQRIIFAWENTPIHPWKLPGVPAEFSLSIKRDDLTGCDLTGNKVRKLEFMMAEAVERGCSHVITCGAVTSNHCRSTALACRHLGLTPHLLLFSMTTEIKADCQANMMFNRMSGANIYLTPYISDDDLDLKMESLAQYIQSTRGESSYIIPFGGSNIAGLFGYIHAFDEMRLQGVLDQFDDLVFTSASGGTLAGLAIANHLTGNHLSLHAFSGVHDASFHLDHLHQTLSQVGLESLEEDHLRVVEGYEGRGYGLSTPEELEFIQKVAENTSIILDPVYTGKAALGLVKELNKRPERFKGRRILFIHTGGIFSLFDGRMTPLLEEKQKRQPSMFDWEELNNPPFSKLSLPPPPQESEV